MGCFERVDEDPLEQNGVCPDCGNETHDGETVWPTCRYSPVLCETCGDQPCDQSC